MSLVVNGAVGDLRQGLLGGRVEHRESAAAVAACPLTSDQQASRDLDASEFGDGAHSCCSCDM
jgi:hypothetical protein